MSIAPGQKVSKNFMPKNITVTTNKSLEPNNNSYLLKTFKINCYRMQSLCMPVTWLFHNIPRNDFLVPFLRISFNF